MLRVNVPRTFTGVVYTFTKLNHISSAEPKKFIVMKFDNDDDDDDEYPLIVCRTRTVAGLTLSNNNAFCASWLIAARHDENTAHVIRKRELNRQSSTGHNLFSSQSTANCRQFKKNINDASITDRSQCSCSSRREARGAHVRHLPCKPEAARDDVWRQRMRTAHRVTAAAAAAAV